MLRPASVVASNPVAPSFDCAIHGNPAPKNPFGFARLPAAQDFAQRGRFEIILAGDTPVTSGNALLERCAA